MTSNGANMPRCLQRGALFDLLLHVRDTTFHSLLYRHQLRYLVRILIQFYEKYLPEKERGYGIGLKQDAINYLK